MTGRHLQRLLLGNYPAVTNECYGDIENRVAFWRTSVNWLRRWQDLQALGERGAGASLYPPPAAVAAPKLVVLATNSFPGIFLAAARSLDS